MNEPAHPLLLLRGVGRSFGAGAGATHALHRIDLRVMRGEFVAVVGSSGAGKSTLLNIIGLLDRPTSGEFRFAGESVSDLSERDRDRIRSRRIGFVFQDSHVLLDESALNNAALGLQVQGVRFSERRSRVSSLLASLGLGHRVGHPARELSGGERQRVAMARAVATQPELLLADEPTGSLDRANTELLIAYLRRLHAGGTTVVVITHDPLVASAAERQVIIEDGVVRDDGIRAPGVHRDAPEAPDIDASMLELDRGSRHRTRLTTRIWDDVMDAVSNHSSRPGRTMLLLVAFLLGIGGLVASVGLSQSAAIQVADRVTEAGLDEVIVRTTLTGSERLSFFAPRGSGGALDRIEELSGVKGAGYFAAVSASDAAISLLPTTSTSSQQAFTGSIVVSDSDFISLQGAQVSPPRAVTLLDNGWDGDVALVGHRAAELLGVQRGGPGVVVWLNGRPVDVVGIIESGGRLASLEDAIVLSRGTAEGLAAVDPQILVRTEPGHPAPLAKAIPLTAYPGEPAAVAIETVADLRSLRRGIQSDLLAFVGVISAMLLILAALTAATSMYLSVHARSGEIALRRAIGASRAAIWRLFTLEGLVIGMAGGITGAAVGMSAVLAVTAILDWVPALNLDIVFFGVALGAVTGILSATYPAIVAARADPAAAIRR